MAAHDARKPSRRGRYVVATVSLGLIGGFATPAMASPSHDRSCNASCAESTVHHPRKATTYAVQWRHYPYAHEADPRAIDPWGSIKRQCTGYVTWSLNAMGVDFGALDSGKNGRTVHFFSALGWATAARKGGWKVSHKPTVGSVAQWRAHESSHWETDGLRHNATAGEYGHVAIVTKVYDDGTVLMRQYNAGHPGRRYSSIRGKAPRYLHIGVK